jgi:hypothetical protein
VSLSVVGSHSSIPLVRWVWKASEGVVMESCSFSHQYGGYECGSLVGMAMCSHSSSHQCGGYKRVVRWQLVLLVTSVVSIEGHQDGSVWILILSATSVVGMKGG